MITQKLKINKKHSLYSITSLFQQIMQPCLKTIDLYCSLYYIFIDRNMNKITIQSDKIIILHYIQTVLFEAFLAYPILVFTKIIKMC